MDHLGGILFVDRVENELALMEELKKKRFLSPTRSKYQTRSIAVNVHPNHRRLLARCLGFRDRCCRLGI